MAQMGSDVRYSARTLAAVGTSPLDSSRMRKDLQQGLVQ